MYVVTYAPQMIEDEMKVLLPKMSKSDIAKLQSEVIFQILSKSISLILLYITQFSRKPYVMVLKEQRNMHLQLEQQYQIENLNTMISLQKDIG